MSELILNDGDLADAGHWPVECVLGFYEGRPSGERASFADHVDALCAGEGYADDEEGCTFWGELDDYDRAREDRFEGECYAPGGVCKLTYAEFYGYLETACARYSRRHPAARASLEVSLADYRKRFL